MRHDSHFVEQLFRADELPVGRKIPIHLLEANPDQPRSVLGDLSDLKQSIIEKGVLEPILVRPREDGRYTIISGERRFRASLEAGLAEIPCIEMSVPDNELLEIALIENLQRKDLTPFEEAEGYHLLRQKHSYTHEEIATAVGRSRVTVSETLHLSTLPDEVKEQCRRADITSKSFLLELSRLSSEAEMLGALQARQRGEGITRDVLRDAKKNPSAARGSQKRPGHKKAYELTFVPEARNYKLSLVYRGASSSREEILQALRDLARQIERGDIDLEKAGRFLPKRPATKATTKPPGKNRAKA